MSQEFTPEYQALIAAGAMLANCAFNLAQSDKLDERQRRSLDESCKAWDAALPAYDATLRQPAARVDEGMLRNLAHLWRQIERSDEPQTEFDKGYEQASQECASTLEAALSAQPAQVDPLDTAVGWLDMCGGSVNEIADRLSAQPAPEHPAAPVGVPDGIAQAAAFIQKKADDYAAENCGMEHDTGATTYHYGQAGEDYHHTLIELAEEVAALAAAPSAPQGTQQGEG